ncbi:NmrA family NAD(P)-binding protein [Aquincola sp. S2]|uniref:NmrA family NAD(P)-binding protein n=1 Tax=Pseudaquabacterium terrae TaxID=2732868 RepID=A0ABX2EJR7_9BURK|nr:NAD(P)H-binding protein [Aquabacterium terrae]NRF68910.1 NmrA family NAD(P)-binding protein [Aquabacterium terrae]
MSHRILVTGATGHIGRELVRRLQQQRADCAVLVSPSGRTVPGVLGVEADFADPASLARAFKGFDTLFLLLPLVPEKLALARNAVNAARAAGVRHIVRSSAAGADAGSPVAIARLQGQIDELVQTSGLGWTLLRPSFFMQNWVNYHGEQLKAGAWHAPTGNGAIGVIDVRDIADSAAAVLADPAAHAGRSYTLTGAEALSNAQQLAAISEAAGRRIDYVDVPESAAEAAMLGMGMPAPVIEWFMSLHHVVKQGWAAGLSDDVQALTGHAPRRFLDFVAENAGAFR